MQLTMAASLFELVVDRLCHVFAYVERNMQVLAVLRLKSGIHLVYYHFVRATLHWQQLSLTRQRLSVYQKNLENTLTESL